MLFGSKAWYTKRFKTNSLQSFLAREKKKSQKCMKGRGDRPTPPQNTFSEFLGSIWLDFRLDFRHGWIWLDMVGYTQNPIKSLCMSLYTNKYYLTYVFGSREKESSKMYERRMGTGSPLLGIHFWVNCDQMWSWLDLVGYTQISDHLPLQSDTGFNRETTRQDSPEKTTKSKTKTPKENNQNLESDKSSLFWGFLVCVFPVCSGFVFF